MSISYQAKKVAVLTKQLKVQELVLTAADADVLVTSGADQVVIVGEEVASVALAVKHLADGTITGVAAASIVLCDSVALTTGGDKKAIKLVGVSAPVAGDAIVVKYVVK